MFAAIKKLLITLFKARILTKLALPKVLLLWVGYRLLRALVRRKQSQGSRSA
ncbi:hypothetical protein [Nesterenkonia salmonea]|uniref:hypothetical protein n=1 Tax=Nesterenkonia salmonea TaxID=1804987 RepID=UPI0014089A97|nr:hypothetical protein [Nesterenkonia salmonea]